MNIKNLTVTCSFLIGFTFTSSGTLIDSWDFSYADGTELSTALSNNSTSLGGNAEFASVQGNELQFSSTNTTGGANLGTFRGSNLSLDPITSGTIEVSWDVTSADFTNTEVADGNARVGFGLRDKDPSNNDLAFVRLQYTGSLDNYRLQYSNGASGILTAATFAGTTLSNLNIRFLANLDNAGTAGSFQLFYTESGGSEVNAINNGIIEVGTQLDEFRMVQQVTNGGTDWRAGDTLNVDNLGVSVIPEPSALSLLVFAGMVLHLSRKRR